MSTVSARLAAVRRRLDAACVAAGRAPAEVTLVAVSKTHPLPALHEAHALGQVHFGESYAQELRDKTAQWPRPELRWHFIGHLQRNKAKYVAPVAYRVHAVDSVALGGALARRAPAGIDVLIEVNLGGEESKAGVAPAETLPLVRQLAGVEGVRVRGLMCLPPFREDPEDVGPFFAELADLAARCRADGHDTTELSMGMTHDFEVAVRHGATWVRVGTAIFGPRGT